MKMKKYINQFSYILFSVLILSVFGCSSDDDTAPLEDLTDTDAQDLNTLLNGNGVMMQAFYWDVTPQGAWYNEIAPKLTDWAANGVNRIWIAPPSKGQSGINSMGYDPSDYFDLGEFDQHGSTTTRFGSKQDLLDLITKAHDNKIEVIADIVLNHNSGGGVEFNTFRNKDTYTLFDETNGNASGIFNRDFNDYHPNAIHEHDEEALFFEEQDVCHHQEHVQQAFWKADNSVAKYYKNTIGFDGWRFDYVKGFGPWVVKEWNNEVGGFSVGEYFDGHAPNLVKWVEESGSNAFDFACFYRLEEALDRHKDLTILNQDMLRKTHADKAVTFVSNHDTEKDTNEDNYIKLANKMKAYAYIMTHTGYPTVFYNDYEGPFKAELQNLILINRSIAFGAEEILEVTKDEYIMIRGGDDNNPGLVLYLNLSNQTKERKISTHWKDKTLFDYSKHVSESPVTDTNGEVTIKAPGLGYTIWSVK